ncbi:hypothetical protein PUV54_05020 [Hyphococcus flavus]|uniref:Uncharacterized protein n=1 Tax=Hyphococcus flavus TaxID=1866326 RepID=A0AAE9ZF12_9PROT|nr:hypothetical protein [Hyphococcus flavus]WDI32555.1 hypothetical protein PUV54_05020 [Hyphococcus flavus]
MKSVSRKIMIGAAAAALSLGIGAPAMAYGGSHVSVHYSSGYYGGGYHAAGYKSYRHRGHYRHGRRHHRHGGGGKAAAIALGVIGGAIILNELSEDRERARYSRDRYYDGYYDGRRDAGAADYYDRAYDDRYEDEYDYEEAPHEGEYDDGLDDRLDGAAAPARISVDAAYQVCLDHARSALAERGFVVTAPYRPASIEDRGGALLMTANVSAQRGRESWSRAMSCEASDTRVYRLELI